MKNKLAIFLTGTIAALSISFYTAEPSEAAVTLAGDLNCDNRITISDSVLLARLVAEDTTLELSPQALENADANGDGATDANDITYSLMDIAGLIEKTPDERTAVITETTAPALTTAAVTTVVTTAPPQLTTAAPTTKSTATTFKTTTISKVTTKLTTKATTKSTTKTTTKATTKTTTSPPSSGYTEIGSLLVSPYPFHVQRNEIVTLEVIGLENTEYDIDVYYSSGVSKADGLENHKSDSSGYVSWTWKIGGKTKIGTYNIVLKGGGVEDSFEFSVVG